MAAEQLSQIDHYRGFRYKVDVTLSDEGWVGTACIDSGIGIHGWVQVAKDVGPARESADALTLALVAALDSIDELLADGYT